MHPSAGRRGRATRLSSMFANSKVQQKAACTVGAALPSAKFLETPHVPCSQMGRAGTPGRGRSKQSPAASASAAEWVECGMPRGNCLCYFNTNEFRNSFSGGVLNSAPSVTSTPALPKLTRTPGQKKKTEALPSSSHRLTPSFPPALRSFRPWYPGIASI